MGIDYGMGKTNINVESGIRFGVIPTNDLGSFVWDELMAHGDDVDFEEHKEQVKCDLSSAIEKVLEDYGYSRQNDSDELAEEIVDDMSFDNYESSGDCTRYQYKQDGYELSTASDGDLWVMKSPFYTNAPYCSPCAPGAGYLRDGGEDGDCKAYCMGHDWFEGGVAPYPVYSVETNELVLPPAK